MDFIVTKELAATLGRRLRRRLSYVLESIRSLALPACGLFPSTRRITAQLKRGRLPAGVIDYVAGTLGCCGGQIAHLRHHWHGGVVPRRGSELKSCSLFGQLSKVFKSAVDLDGATTGRKKCCDFPSRQRRELTHRRIRRWPPKQSSPTVPASTRVSDRADQACATSIMPTRRRPG